MYDYATAGVSAAAGVIASGNVPMPVGAALGIAVISKLMAAWIASAVAVDMLGSVLAGVTGVISASTAALPLLTSPATAWRKDSISVSVMEGDQLFNLNCKHCLR